MRVRAIRIASSSIRVAVPIKRRSKPRISRPNVADVEARRLRAAGVDDLLENLLAGDLAAALAVPVERESGRPAWR
jgi:hypothetical protein